MRIIIPAIMRSYFWAYRAIISKKLSPKGAFWILMSKELCYQIELSIPFDKAIEKVTSALKDEGFGVLTRIDVKGTLKEKLDVNFRAYVILGACNPPLAHQALESEPQVGLLLPCNVTVEQNLDGVLVSIINPVALLGIKQLLDNTKVMEVATEAQICLERVAASLLNRQE